MSYVITQLIRDGQRITDGALEIVDQSQSCHNTRAGISMSISPEYLSLEEAKLDCKRLNNISPEGGYSVAMLAPLTKTK